MRDPDLVHRAERAAGALERAWDRWRTMHGLGSEPLAPVSSYVGYSMEEPWGQPRVVFGVAADEAEQLAAMLDGHDCYGPVHAEVVGRPDWRHMPVGDAGMSAPSIDDHLSIPQQARPPAADMLPPATYVQEARELDQNLLEPRLATANASEAEGEPKPGDRPGLPAAESAGADPVGALPEISPQELAPLPPLPDPSPAGPVGSASLTPRRVRSKAGKATPEVGYRGPRYEGSSRRYKATPEAATPEADMLDAVTPVPADAEIDADPAAAVAADSAAAADSAIPADSTGAGDAVADVDSAIAPDTAGAVESAGAGGAGVVADVAQGADAQADEPASVPVSKAVRAKPRQTSKSSRARRQGAGIHGAWDIEEEQHRATDRAL